MLLITFSFATNLHSSTLHLMGTADTQEIQFTIKDLNVPFSDESEPVAMNNEGTILIRDSQYIYLIESNGTVQKIDPTILSFADAINNNGIVLGGCVTNSGKDSFYSIRLFDSHTGEVCEICNFNCEEDEELSCHDLNDKGQVVGMKWGLKKDHGFLWDKEHGFTDLGKFNPWFINNEGLMLGTNKGSTLLQLMDIHSKKLQTIGKTNFKFFDLNDKGEVCGTQLKKGKEIGYVWETAKKFKYLNNFLPTVINNNGDMVGIYEKKGRRSVAFWSQGKIQLLPKINPEFGIFLNDRSEILGQTEEGHSILLMDVDGRR